METLFTLGSWAWQSVWTPLIVWTFLAGLLYLILKKLPMHPLAHYYIRLGILTSLPAGLLFVSLMPTTVEVDQSNAFYPILMIVAELGSPTQVMSSVEVAPVWTKTHTIGLISLICALFSMLGLLHHGLKHISLLIHEYSRLHAAPTATRKLAAEISYAIGLRKSPIILISESEEIPYTFGFLKPRVVLPESQNSEEQLKSILAHEIMHVRRGDFAIQWTEQFICSVFLFHPLVHLLVRDLQKYREMSCDAEVISGMYVNPRLYASLLLEFASSSRKPALSVMISMATPGSKIKERISNMQKYSKSISSVRRARIFSLMGATATLLLVTTLMSCSEQVQSVEVPDELQARMNEISDEVFIVVEEMPEPIGGMRAVYNNLVYPELAKRAGIEGRVVVQFVVDERGEILNPHIIRGIGGGCDEAVLEALKGVRFIPGKQRGRAVKVQFQLPVVFRLNNSDERVASNTSGTTRASGESQFSTTLVTENGTASVHVMKLKNEQMQFPKFAILVRDDLGGPLAGAQVTMTEKSTGLSFATATDTNGQATIQNVKVGVYDVSVSYTGMKAPNFGFKVEDHEMISALALLVKE